VAISGFARRILGLERVFPSSGRQVAAPGLYGELVHPVHLWPGPLARFTEVVAEDAVGAAGAFQVVSAAVPEGTVRHVLWADMFHNQAAGAQFDLEFAIRVGAGVGAPISIAQSASAGQGWGLNGPIANHVWSLNNTHPRGVFLPPQSSLLGNLRNIPGFAFVAPAVLTLRLRFIDYPLADLPSF